MSSSTAGRQMFEGIGAPVHLDRIDAGMDPTLDSCCQREVRRLRRDDRYDMIISTSVLFILLMSRIDRRSIFVVASARPFCAHSNMPLYIPSSSISSSASSSCVRLSRIASGERS